MLHIVFLLLKLLFVAVWKDKMTWVFCLKFIFIFKQLISVIRLFMSFKNSSTTKHKK
ncbi:hypothetical protein HanRHA438_Chr09g0388781 [Helianthus annuus]|nr:hypothetical protein HanHA89_Chr09g0330291 [Helianthus annuus]KAJ0620599.1 hypothetical protein HanHA300_Chr00c0824g0815551 [Helianthus annuus]KAJ0706669.1 hypothetical protein HanLR1_Chr09g0309721 [Helianthus annuus]KAJ0887260.1 hypothetical protein HanRHA438_Chr09g0388781 [Helianthus annuus]